MTHHPYRVMPLAAVATALASLVTLAACSSPTDPADAAEGTRPSASSATPASPTSSTPPSAPTEKASPLVGTWSASFTWDDIEAQLTANGLGQGVVDAVREGSGAGSAQDLAADLEIRDGFILLTWTADGRPLGVMDRQAYEIQGRRVVLSPQGLGCSSTLRWTVSGGRLTMRLVEDDCPDAFGAPNEAFMMSEFMVVPFERMSA